MMPVLAGSSVVCTVSAPVSDRAVVSTVLSTLLDRWAQAGDLKRLKAADEAQGSAKLDTDAAASDKRPTSASTAGAAGLALLAAVTLDGVPENLALGISLGEGTGGLALALSGTDREAISMPLAFAAGAVIASLADTLMPEAYEHGGPAVALTTAAGFVLSLA